MTDSKLSVLPRMVGSQVDLDDDYFMIHDASAGDSGGRRISPRELLSIAPSTAWQSGLQFLLTYPPSVWLDAEVGVTVSGTNVTAWQSREGNAYDFVQAVAGEQPVYSASEINGKPAIVFNGTDESLSVDSFPLTGEVGIIWAAIKTSASTSVQTIFSMQKKDSDADYLRMMLTGNLGISWNDGGTTAGLYSAAATTSSTLALAVLSNGSTASGRINGAAVALNPGTGTNTGVWAADLSADRMSVGRLMRSTANGPLNAALAEIIVYDGTILPASVIAEVETYLAAKYGITLVV